MKQWLTQGLDWWREQPKLTPTIKLTLSYLGILMAVSLVLTVPLYRVSVGEAERSLRREQQYFGSFYPGNFDPGYDDELSKQLDSVRHRLQANLAGLNLVILIVGGGLSYYLARRTLSPIEAALAAQSRFAADASHELRTPLTVMKSEIEVALRDDKLTAGEARQLLASNLEEVAKLEALSGGLLRLARHEQEPLPLVRVPLASVTERAITRLEAVAAKRGVTVTATNLDFAVAGDADSLVELAVILLDNAIKYSPKGAEVQLSARRQGRLVDLIIRDHGTGIAPTDLPHIFERFYRADASRSKDTPGYGLGLSIAAQIAELHRATIDATSRLGTGSTFVIHLPAWTTSAA